MKRRIRARCYDDDVDNDYDDYDDENDDNDDGVVAYRRF